MRILAAVGAVLLWLGLLAGAANREVLDGAVRLFRAVDQLNGVS